MTTNWTFPISSSEFHWRSDPGTDGVGVAFTSLPLDLGDAQDPASRTTAFTQVSRALGVPVVVVTQVHGAKLWEVTETPSGPLSDRTDVAADALITTQRGVGLAVRVADCVPVLIADERACVVAAVHAGRAGLLAGVIGAAMDAMRAISDAPLRAWVGPHICADCYEVPEDMAADASARLGIPRTRTRWGTPGIDLGTAAHHQIRAAGGTVIDRSVCTLTTPTLPSHRRGGDAARLAGIIWLENSP